MTMKIGTQFKMYYSSTPLADIAGATVKAHGWTLNDNVQSTDVNSSRDETTVTIRQDGGTDIDIGGKRTDEFSFQVAYDTSDAFYAALKSAYDADGDIALADADGDIATNGTVADAGNFKIKQFNASRPESGAATISVTAKPTAIFALGVVIPV